MLPSFEQGALGIKQFEQTELAGAVAEIGGGKTLSGRRHYLAIENLGFRSGIGQSLPGAEQGCTGLIAVVCFSRLV